MRKKALITGASRGIGEAIAKELARQGFDLTLTCLNSLDQLKELAGGLEKKYGVSCHIFQGDMGDPEAVDRLFDGLNRLDVLINNAGISHIGLLSDMSVSQWRRVMSTNLDSCFYTCRRAIPLMVHAKQGRIINISSVWGQAGAFHGSRLFRFKGWGQQSYKGAGKRTCSQQYPGQCHCLRGNRYRYEPLLCP